MKPDDKRKNNGGHNKGNFKWGEKKVRIYLSLTPTAKKWLKAKGGPDFVEKLARGQ